jgi:hypothetical protein
MPVIFIFLSSNQTGSCCDNRKDYTIFSGKMTVKKGMVQFWVAASSAQAVSQLGFCVFRP